MIVRCVTCGVSFRPRLKRRKGYIYRYCSIPCYAKQKTVPAVERFWPKVAKTDGCWHWRGRLNREGYGKFYVGVVERKYVYISAQRWAWEQINGPVPPGLVLDHLCRNRACVRPDHLEPVTSGTNVLRGESPSAQCARKLTCKRGHPFDEANTRQSTKGHRMCVICIRESGKVHQR